MENRDAYEESSSARTTARSQMAEALLKHSCGEIFHVESAGTHPGQLNPLAVEVMAEIGIDISQNKTKSIFPFMRERPGLQLRYQCL